jgi:hypothetical protein
MKFVVGQVTFEAKSEKYQDGITAEEAALNYAEEYFRRDMKPNDTRTVSVEDIENGNFNLVEVYLSADNELKVSAYRNEFDDEADWDRKKKLN